MDNEPKHKLILQLFSLYYLLSGIAAIFTPSLWYLAGGVTPARNPTDLILGVVGAMMVGIAIGLNLLRVVPKAYHAAYSMVFVSSLLDGGIVCYGWLQQEVPSLNACLLVAIDLVCCGVSLIMYNNFSKDQRV